MARLNVVFPPPVFLLSNFSFLYTFFSSVSLGVLIGIFGSLPLPLPLLPLPGFASPPVLPDVYGAWYQFALFLATLVQDLLEYLWRHWFSGISGAGIALVSLLTLSIVMPIFKELKDD